MVINFFGQYLIIGVSIINATYLNKGILVR